jgi:hypothetical protein
VYLANVPVGIVALAYGRRRLPRVDGHPVARPGAGGAVLVTAGVAALTLGLVKGHDWGWGAPQTLAALIGAAAALTAFAVHCARHDNPLVDAALFRARAFTGSSIVSIAFSVAFGGMLLSVVLWCQDVWGWSALRTGLAIAPGPLMVPLFSFLVAARLIPRIGPGPVIGIGATIFAAGTIWWALAAGVRPDYAGEMLGGMLLTGVGVGLTLPTYMAAGAASLPPQAFATGSAVVNMLRQVGLAIGVAVLVAVLGTPTAPAVVEAYRHGWEAIAAASLLAAACGVVLMRRPRAAPLDAPAAGAVAAL